MILSGNEVPKIEILKTVMRRCFVLACLSPTKQSFGFRLSLADQGYAGSGSNTNADPTQGFLELNMKRFSAQNFYK
jgi:hypothetical protein